MSAEAEEVPLTDIAALLTKPYTLDGQIMVVSDKRLRVSQEGQSFDSFSCAPGWGSLYFTQLTKQFYFVNHTKNGEVLLDLGCGSAELMERLWRNGKRCSYIGIDYSKKSLKRREEIIAKASNIVKAILVQDDVAAGICLASNSVDKVVFSEVVEHFNKEDGAKVLMEILRVLKPGGTLYLTTSKGVEKPLSGHLHEYEFEEIWETVAQVNFVIEKTYGLYCPDESCFSEAELAVFQEMKEFYTPRLMRTVLSLKHPKESRSWLIVASKPE